MAKFYFPPISGVRVFANDLVVVRSRKKPSGIGKRDKVRNLSKASLKRLAFVASNTQIDFRTLLTLTYPENFPCNGTVVKGHLRKMLNQLVAVWGEFEYLWFLEFQKRGAPHIHILTNVLPWSWEQMTREQRYISATWYCLVDSGDIKHLYAGTRFEKLRKSDGGKRYAISYARKPTQKAVPKDFWDVGRFWGCTPRVRPVPIAEISCNERELRQLLEDWQYLPGGELPKVLYNTSGQYAPLLLDLERFKNVKKELDRQYWNDLNKAIENGG